MDPEQTPLRRGLALAKQAVDDDANSRFHQAINNYKQAARLLTMAYRGT
jgi:hypothetical protein